MDFLITTLCVNEQIIVVETFRHAERFQTKVHKGGSMTHRVTLHDGTETILKHHTKAIEEFST